MKLAALYREHQDHLKSYPQELLEMRLKLRSLDYEASRLKGLELEVGRLQALLSESQQKLLLAETKVVENDRLASLLEQQTQEISDLQARLNTSEMIIISLEASQTILQEEKQNAKVEKEEVEEELIATIQLLKDAESRCEKLKKKYCYYKAKAA